MNNFSKQLFSFILPVTVLIVIPLYIEDNFKIFFSLISITGIVLICLGLGIMIITTASVIQIGKGTLAPWTPTKKLVVSGTYAYVRNPMIEGVLAVLTGEAILFLSLNIFIWAVVFFFINNIYFSLSEEPGLEKRFGNEYVEYKENVRRWIPKLRPFKPDND